MIALDILARAGCELLRPVTSRLPRGGLRVVRFMGGDRDDLWRKSPERIVHDRWIGAKYCVDLTEWSGRWHYFSGRFVDLAHFLLLRSVLKPGDIYLDVGANRGVHSIAAAGIVGASGKVISVEPYPPVAEALRRNLALNGINNAEVLTCGLDSTPGELTLSATQAGGHTGTNTFRPVESGCALMQVAVTTGDDIVEKYAFQQPLFVKIDVEGLEYRVLRGFSKTLKRPDVRLAVEITPDWLVAQGTGAAEIFRMMAAEGFDWRCVSVEWRHWRPHLRLSPLTLPLTGQADIFFWKPAKVTSNGSL